MSLEKLIGTALVSSAILFTSWNAQADDGVYYFPKEGNSFVEHSSFGLLGYNTQDEVEGLFYIEPDYSMDGKFRIYFSIIDTKEHICNPADTDEYDKLDSNIVLFVDKQPIRMLQWCRDMQDYGRNAPILHMTAKTDEGGQYIIDSFKSSDYVYISMDGRHRALVSTEGFNKRYGDMKDAL